MSDIRMLPAQAQRVETGPVQFGDDWPGVFIRGDHAFWLVGCVDTMLAALKLPRGDELIDSIALAGLQGLRNTLAASDLTGLSSRALLAQETAASRAAEWQSIESAPKDGPILAYNPVQGVYATRYDKGEWPHADWYSDDLGRAASIWYPRPTHWMPLPKAPAPTVSL